MGRVRVGPFYGVAKRKTLDGVYFDAILERSCVIEGNEGFDSIRDVTD